MIINESDWISAATMSNQINDECQLSVRPRFSYEPAVEVDSECERNMVRWTALCDSCKVCF